jgi:signal transduction histidine kinase
MRSKPGSLAAFLLIALLVAGGLGWATAAALRLEREQLAQRAAAQHANKLRLAMWRLDSSVAPVLAREDSRPFSHFSPVYAPPLAFNANGGCWAAGEVLEPSPLLGEELPGWMRLHFQVSPDADWLSPQVPSADLVRHFRSRKVPFPLVNVTPRRAELLGKLGEELSPAGLVAQARTHTRANTLRETTLLLPHDSTARTSRTENSASDLPEQLNDYVTRLGQQSRRMKESQALPQVFERDAALNIFAPKKGNELWNHRRTDPPDARVVVRMGPMVPFWAEGKRRELVLLRLVRVEDMEVCQGVLLDADRLREELTAEVADLFPEARLVAVRDRLDPDALPEHPEQTMTALPFRLDVGEPPPAADPGWTPLRIGLALAWLAALVALGAVGLGGWSLLDLSQRRMRFVSAVTHELRTPLTTFRLYLDMLAGGFVQDEKQREEYVQTLNAEAERLHRLVANVLDFSRLEDQRPQLRLAAVPVQELLDRLTSGWEGRCRETAKELVVENPLAADARVWADADVAQQILGNLIDNACKYSSQAEDRRVCLRVRAEPDGIVFEVEDHGPGVPARERGSIFRPFRRGRVADRTTGGVGLGLALARRWARLLGGQLTLHSPATGGACFRLKLQCSPADPACREPRESLPL